MVVVGGHAAKTEQRPDEDDRQETLADGKGDERREEAETKTVHDFLGFLTINGEATPL
jgi:hypothetical protein